MLLDLLNLVHIYIYFRICILFSSCCDLNCVDFSAITVDSFLLLTFMCQKLIRIMKVYQNNLACIDFMMARFMVLGTFNNNCLLMAMKFHVII